MKVNLANYRECTGCMACKNICSQSAIHVYMDSLGFTYPYIDTDKCIGCGACEKICPIINYVNKKISCDICYAVQAEDEIRKESSSGGVFSIVARYVLQQGGNVCGATYEDGIVRHCIIDNESELFRLSKSKYVQSDISYIYEKINAILKTDKMVLFCGTPCQCTAVKKYCGDSDNLVLIDILCMGVPSQKLFERYLEEDFSSEIVEMIDFRDKSVEGWTPNLYLKVKTKQGETLINHSDSTYYSAFLQALTIREACTECKFAGGERIGDITLGDFWGIGNYKRDLDDGLGTSMVLINTDKGRKLFELCKMQFKLHEEIPFQVACANNPILLHPTGNSGRRSEFIDEYNGTNLRECVSHIISNKADCGIINYWWCNDNGAILTAYALQKTLKKMGYSSRLIDMSTFDRCAGISKKFETEFLQTTSHIYTSKQFNQLNDAFEHFLVGSDQVFRVEWVTNRWFLDFVKLNKNKISVAASFGNDDVSCSHEKELELKYLLSRFNSLSTREDTGIGIFKKLGVKGEHIIDPVFWIKPKEYINDLHITDNHTSERYIFAYFRDKSEIKECVCKDIAEKLSCAIIYADDATEVKDFIACIAYCQFVITDSYHGLCFSLIFNKKYICFWNILRGNTRFDSLINLLSLDRRRFVTENAKKLSLDHIVALEEDWDRINELTQKSVEFSRNWLNNALVKKKSNNYLKLTGAYFNWKRFVLNREVLRSISRAKFYLQRILNKGENCEEVVCFGAGGYGLNAINFFGEKISFFIDNDKKKRGIQDYVVLPWKMAKNIITDHTLIVISVSEIYADEICSFLKEKGHSKFVLLKDYLEVINKKKIQE